MSEYDEDDDTAAIDVAVSFFCAVLVLFVFIAFNIDRDPQSPVLETKSQDVLTVPAQVPAWSAINQRGSFAIWEEETLLVLDMSSIGVGMRKITDQYQGPDGYFNYSRGAENSPASFRIDVGLFVQQAPETWIRLRVGVDDDCPQDIRPLVTVFLSSLEPDVSRLISLAERCEFRVRYETLAPLADEGWGSFSLQLGQAAYGAERIFR
jgi:hypothetical protein